MPTWSGCSTPVSARLTRARHSADVADLRRSKKRMRRFCASRSVFGQRMRWVTCVAPPILRTDIHDHGFRALSLNLEGGGERVFGVHDHPVRDSFQPYSDGKLHPQALLSFLRPRLRHARATRAGPRKTLHPTGG